MIIDITFLALMLLALFKGYKRGFIVAVFSIIALIIGLAAAMKLSTVAAEYLKDSVNISARWLPVISFLLVFLIVVFIVRLIATAIEKTIELALLGWLNRLAGMLLYAVLYTVILSVVIFYTQKINLLSAQTLAASKTHPFIQPWGSRAIEGLGLIIPAFKGMFHELGTFFEKTKL
ncbi:MAG: CvpA family protein [Chitinophagaceae bacterium]